MVSAQGGFIGCYFNSRPSARGDRRDTSDRATKAFQFTPLREGRRSNRAGEFIGEAISIHAPPRGATHEPEEPQDANSISIHAPPRGATRSGCACSVVGGIFQFTPLREGRRTKRNGRDSPIHFNSRPSARGDGNRPKQYSSGQRISIHAPPRGATHEASLMLANSFISIHAPPRGATTRPADGSRFAPYFNSRPSARGDQGIQLVRRGYDISIHAPPRGATQHGQRLGLYCAFQFTPLREGRPNFDYSTATDAAFQFTPLREGRRVGAFAAGFCRIYFNSRPSARGDEVPEEEC